MAVTNEGINHILNVEFKGATQVTSWYMNLFTYNYTPVVGDTAASFPTTAGEATMQISEGARQAFNPATSTAQSLTNTASKATFTAATTFTAYGAGVYSSAVKGGTSGVLFCASKFPTAKSLEAGDQLLVTATINGASA